MSTSFFLAIKLNFLDLWVCHVSSLGCFFWFPFFDSPDSPDWFYLPGRQYKYGRSTSQANSWKCQEISKGTGFDLFFNLSGILQSNIKMIVSHGGIDLVEASGEIYLKFCKLYQSPPTLGLERINSYLLASHQAT